MTDFYVLNVWWLRGFLLLAGISVSQLLLFLFLIFAYNDTFGMMMKTTMFFTVPPFTTFVMLNLVTLRRQVFVKAEDDSKVLWVGYVMFDMELGGSVYPQRERRPEVHTRGGCCGLYTLTIETQEEEEDPRPIRGSGKGREQFFLMLGTFSDVRRGQQKITGHLHSIHSGG